MKAGHPLFVAYGGGHVALLAPVASALLAAGRPFTFLGLTTARIALDRMGIPSIGFHELPGATRDDVQAWGRILAEEMPDGGPISSKESIAYLGLNFRDLVHDVGEAEAWRRYRVTGRQAFLPVRTMEATLSSLTPDLVVATNSPRAEQAAILAAGHLGIPSICAVDLFALQEVKWIGQPAYADRVCVINERVREMLLAHGRFPHEIIVTGNPAFDRLSEADTKAHGAALRRKRGWDDGRITLLWASQFEPECHPFADRYGDPSLPRRVEKELRRFIGAHQGYRLVVRYHPSERLAFVPGERIEFSPMSENISVLLHAVDIVIVTASTVGLEASIAGRPVISVDASVFTPDTLYSKMGVSTGVNHPSDLHEVLHDFALSGGNTRSSSISTSSSSGLGVTATDRLLSVIESFL